MSSSSISSAALVSPLSSVSIWEKDRNGQVLNAWSYPGLDPDAEPVILARSGLKTLADAQQNASFPDFTFSKYKSLWIYIVVRILSGSNADLPSQLARVSQFVVVVCATEFHPEKYKALATLMAELYEQEGHPLLTLQCYLSVFGQGLFKKGTEIVYRDNQFDTNSAYQATPVTQLVSTFGDDIKLLYLALSAQKRVAVVCESISLLLNYIRAFPLLARKNWNILWPYIAGHPNEFEDIYAAGVYIAGFSTVPSPNDYDLLVDISEKAITIAPHAKDEIQSLLRQQEINPAIQKMLDDVENAI